MPLDLKRCSTHTHCGGSARGDVGCKSAYYGDTVPVDFASSELGDGCVVFRFDANQEIFNLSIIDQICVRAVFLDPTDAFRVAAEGFQIGFFGRVHTPAQRRCVELPEVDLRDVVIQRQMLPSQLPFLAPPIGTGVTPAVGGWRAQPGPVGRRRFPIHPMNGLSRDRMWSHRC
jgi:hypothetical protein